MRVQAATSEVSFSRTCGVVMAAPAPAAAFEWRVGQRVRFQTAFGKTVEATVAGYDAHAGMVALRACAALARAMWASADRCRPLPPQTRIWNTPRSSAMSGS